MQSKGFGLLFLVALVIFSGVQAKAENSTNKIDGKVTFERLGNLDNRIKVLEKRLKIKELESKIKEIEDKSEPKKDMLKMLKQKINSRQAQKNSFSTGSVKMQNDNNGQSRKKEDKDFKDYISTFRVVSINGFDDKLQAKIESAKHGSLMVKQGHEYDNLGQVKDITMHNVVLKKNDKKYIISHKRDVMGVSENSGFGADSTNIR